MSTEATALIRSDDDQRVIGIRAKKADGELEIHADLVIACDGRSSILRADAKLPVQDFGAPMDVLWFRLPRKPTDIDNTYAAPATGRMMVMLDRNDYWQSAYLIAKGSGDALRARPLEEFRALVAPLLPFDDAAARMASIGDWDQVKLLEVKVDRLQRWHLPGLLLIGDAAHAMSPIGGVGINLAIQDAVATANIVGPALRDGREPTESLLARVQRRRTLPTRLTQMIQRFAQRALIAKLLEGKPGGLLPFPPLLRFLTRFRFVRQIPGRVFGYGFRRERVRLPASGKPASR